MSSSANYFDLREIPLFAQEIEKSGSLCRGGFRECRVVPTGLGSIATAFTPDLRPGLLSVVPTGLIPFPSPPTQDFVLGYCRSSLRDLVRYHGR